MLKHFILLSSLLGLLTACGGGGGGGTKTPEPTPIISSSSLSSLSLSSSSASSINISSATSISSSSSSSISTSSSSSSIDPCNNTSGTIFSECLNTNYGSIVGAQYSPSYLEYTESDTSQQVQWSIVDTASEYNKALSVTFKDNARKGQIFIGHPGETPATQDLSQFQTGSLEFDLRILGPGDAYDYAAEGVVFIVRMDCAWPCSSHEARVVIPTLGSWVHVNISIADLLASGLDPSKVSASLVLIPKGNQANLNLQLDNIQLSKGGAIKPSTVILKEDFNTKEISQWQFTKAVGNASASATTYSGFGAALSMNWLAMMDTLRFETTLDKNIDITNTDASFQINCWNNTNRNFTFQMVATDTNGITTTTRASDGTSIDADTWYNVSAQLGSVFDSGFDPTRVVKFGVQFRYLGVSASATSCQVDTIRIKPTVATLQ